MVVFQDPLSTSVFVRTVLIRFVFPFILIRLKGLQTQSATNPTYAGPWDAIKKIYGGYGIAGLYKGQVITLWREATGYGVYFWAYEKLMQREIATKGIRRDQVSPAKAVLFGAAAGYVVSKAVVLAASMTFLSFCS